MNLTAALVAGIVVASLLGGVATLYYRSEYHEQVAKNEALQADLREAKAAALSAQLLAEARKNEALLNARIAANVERQNATLDQTVSDLKGALRNAGNATPEARKACAPSDDQLRLLNAGGVR